MNEPKMMLIKDELVIESTGEDGRKSTLKLGPDGFVSSTPHGRIELSPDGCIAITVSDVEATP